MYDAFKFFDPLYKYNKISVYKSSYTYELKLVNCTNH